ncbi:metal-dependent hydrolase [Salinicoccus sp. ID82-1]|uniref:metal-dependent hydrolase n=1 Tax=Salinicoccus sp. ID82-1 TaxID=2820269 RepID=UPI001F427C55|nr:metal-dependent hydrolase [Salinicoccus sp. ID82-1]MCG1010958.1 metal-dependent hydrolase [Salinicoccus sp. ID82-1]
MDTLTHTLMGGTIVGLAAIDPSIDPVSVGFITTVVGASLVPDVDTVMKLKNNAVYITHHRGITHSLPFTFFIWPVLLTALSVLLFDLPALNMYLWIQFAVFMHVFVDIFNSYGTQALRPLRHIWIQIGIINTIDVPILLLHVLYFILWYFTGMPVLLFIGLYAVLAIYYITRYMMQRSLVTKVTRQLPNEEISRLFCMPTIHYFEWRIVVVTKKAYYVGRSFRGNIIFYDRFNKSKPIEEERFKSIKQDENFKAFTFFSSIYRYEVTDISDKLVEIRYIDLRYLKEGHYPFVCIMQVDRETHEVLHSYTGWVFTESKLQKKLLGS